MSHESSVSRDSCTARRARAAESARASKRDTGVCAACGADGELKRCARCDCVAYCDAVCQREHWKTHRSHCKRWSAARAARADATGEADEL